MRIFLSFGYPLMLFLFYHRFEVDTGSLLIEYNRFKKMLAKTDGAEAVMAKTQVSCLFSIFNVMASVVAELSFAEC